MKNFDFGMGLVLLMATQLPALAAPDATNTRRLMENYGRSAVVFEENVGQATRGVDFLGRGLFHALSLNAAGATLAPARDAHPDELRLTLVNANEAAKGVGVDRSDAKIGYMLGTDRNKWLSNVPVFQKVQYRQVWPGIDVVYYGTQSHLEYDFVVSPGADLNAIQLQFTGAKSLRLNAAGDLVLQTSEGTMEQHRPHIYQRRDGQMTDVDGHYVIAGNTVRFAVGDYDPAQELVIDPVLIYGEAAIGNYFTSVAVAVDSAGYAYYVGQLNQGFVDSHGNSLGTQLAGYILRLDPTGATPSFSASTFGGLTAPTAPSAVTIDSSNNIYVVGTTGSEFFTTITGFQPHLAGGTDAFLLKIVLGSNGFGAVYTTFLGGTGNDTAKAVATDNSGKVYIVGQTVSADFPVTLGPPFHGNSTTMGFAVAIDTTVVGTGSKLWATLLGGNGTDSANGVMTNGNGSITIGGSSNSTAFQPAVGFGFAPAKSNGTALDGFILVLGPSGNSPTYFTFWPFGPINAIGGSGSTVYATGTTTGNIPTTQTGYQLSPSGPTDAFVIKLNTALSSVASMVYSSYLGGTGSDAGYGIAADSSGNAYVTGQTTTVDFPVTAGNIALPAGNASPYGFFSIVNTAATGTSGLSYSTLLSASPTTRGLGGSPINTNIGNGVAYSNSTGSVVVAANGPGNPTIGMQFGFSNTTIPQTSLSPTTGSGPSQSFTFTFTDPNGYTDIAGAGLLINTSLVGSNGCYILFARPDVISLVDDTGNPVAGHVTSTSLGAPAVLQNSQCVVLASQTTQVGSGNAVQLTLTVVFKPGFAGAKTVWSNVNNNAGQTLGFQQLGTYTATVQTQSLAATAVTPSAGTGQGQPFTVTYFDPYGAPDISGARLVFNSAFTLAGGCYILFDSGNNISLATDDGNGLIGTAKLGKQTALQNSQCIVYPGNSYQTQIGQTLNLTAFVAFKPSFAGTKNIYADVQNNAGTRSAFPQLGTYTVAASTPLGVNSVNPVTASGPSQLFSFVYADPNGFADIASTQVIINPSSATTNSCAVTFNRAANTIALAADDGSAGSSASLGQATTLANSRCIINAAASSQYGFGNYQTLNLFVTMKISGAETVYSSVTSNAPATVGPVQVGTWNVSSPSIMTPVSVTPFTGAGSVGTPQSLTFTLSNPAGSSDISGALIVLYPSLQGASACYILWGHNNNLLSVASDNAQTFTSATAGTPGLLSNSQCTLDTSQSFAVETGNTVNLTLSVSFKNVYQQFQQFYSWANVQNKASSLSGWSLLSRFSVQ